MEQNQPVTSHAPSVDFVNALIAVISDPKRAKAHLDSIKTAADALEQDCKAYTAEVAAFEKHKAEKVREHAARESALSQLSADLEKRRAIIDEEWKAAAAQHKAADGRFADVTELRAQMNAQQQLLEVRESAVKNREADAEKHFAAAVSARQEHETKLAKLKQAMVE
jgi:chromosome segregation ATPase